VQVIVDGSDPGTTRTLLGYVTGILQSYSQGVVTSRLQRRGLELGRLPTLEPQLRAWYNPELRSVNFMVPAVLALILLVVTMSMTSLAVVREREVGTLEQLVVTPIRPSELLLGKIVPFVIIGMADVLLIILVARFWFAVPLAGSVLLLLALALLFVGSGLGLGLFISTVSRTQQQATMTVFFIMMPSILLSGFMFPIANMPRVIQWLTYLIPLRYFLVVVRGIFLKGNGLAVLWPQAAALAVLGGAILALAITRFHKRLD
jgi:ABC-2 type transport system permease protein